MKLFNEPPKPVIFYFTSIFLAKSAVYKRECRFEILPQSLTVL